MAPINTSCSAAALCNGSAQSFKSLMAMVALGLLVVLPCSVGLTCPSSCSTVSPLPYPFGAAPGCGSPGFLLDCSISPPRWNVTTGGYTSYYYIISISSNPNHSNPQAGSYGYGGIVLVDVRPTTHSTCVVLDAGTAAGSDFIMSNLYAFEDAELTYLYDSYLFFNCTAVDDNDPPTSGVFMKSSPSCTRYLEYCRFSNTSCWEYIPYQSLQLSPFKSIYGCTTRIRFVIPPGDDNISTWKSYTQFAWGPVKDADSCNACQRTGGTCGYDTQDQSFLCFCNDNTYPIDCNTGNSKAIAIGVSLSAAALLFLGGIAFICRHKCRMFVSRKCLKLDGVNEAALELPYWALSAATKSFSTKIGQGAFAKVYKGVLHDGSEVAVKVLNPSVLHADNQFLNEVSTIGNIHHINIARLVGYCFNKSRRILVYEYVSNGSLDKYLFSTSQAGGELVLGWKQRFQIALGVAQGLSYMHEECRRCIIHCDIKPQNILLDAAYRPKIADFGLARLLKREESRVLTHARGTPGYVAPEFWSLGSGPLSTKFDVYSYGMVLLEIIRGRKSFDTFDPFAHEEADLDSFVSVLIDERIEHDADLEQAQMCTQVALWCIQDNPVMRPTMRQVVQYLQGTAVVPNNPPSPFRPAQLHTDSSSDAFLKSSDGTSTSLS